MPELLLVLAGLAALAYVTRPAAPPPIVIEVSQPHPEAAGMGCAPFLVAVAALLALLALLIP